MPIPVLIGDDPVLDSVLAHEASTIGYGTDAAEYGWDSRRRRGWIRNLIWQYEIPQSPSLGFIYASERLPSTDMTEHGDSGGPLIAWSPSLGRAVVIGVTSGLRDTHGFHIFAYGAGGIGEGYYGVWAPVRSWVLPYLDDADNDGVRDEIDNCPPSRCAVSADCANPLQEDDDNDGVGDACDNCPPVFCETNPQIPPHFCTNPADENGVQSDLDGDGIGDRCDPCPLDPSDGVLNRKSTALGSSGWRLVTDDDGDGVGNACDRCPTMAVPPASCGLGTSCPPVGTRPVACVGTYGLNDLLVSGRCAEMGDADDDGRGDACDTCMMVPDMDRNSNRISELLENAPPQDDACDEAPIAISSMDVPEVVAVPSPENQHLDVHGPTQVASFFSFPHIGKFDPADAPRPYVSSIGYRFCDCYDPTDGPLPLDKCMGAETGVGQCHAVNPWVSSRYKVPSLANESHTPLGDPAILNTSFVSGQTQPLGPTIWNWYQDSFAYPTMAFERNGYRAMWAAMVARVHRGGTVQLSSNTDSLRDASHDVRDVFFEMGGPSYVEANEIYVPDSLPPNGCVGGLCNLVLRPWMSRVNPLPFEESIFDFVRDGAWTIPVGDRVAALRPGRTAIDITDKLSPGIVSAISSRDSIFVPAAESGSSMWQSREIQALIVPARWSEGSNVDVVRMTQLGLRLDNERLVDDSVFAVSAQTSDGPTPSARTGASLVFSGVAETLFVVGGFDEDEPRRDIWRYSVRAETWRRVAFGSAHAPDTVLAATYLPETYELLVLDETKPTHGPRLARLVVYDTRTGQSRLVRVWPRVGAFRKLALVTDDTGQVVLVGSTQMTTMLFRMRIENSSVRFTGHRLVLGQMWDMPVSTEDGLLMAVKRPQRVDVLRIRWDDLGRPQPCGSL